MRIGVMLRHLGQHGGGVLVYTENLLPELLRTETDHEWVLMHQGREHVGRFGSRPGLDEVVLQSSNKLVWDQVAVPRFARRHDLDIVFNPKYSAPLTGSFPVVWVCHGLDWRVEPRWSRWRDRISHRLLVPRYAKRAERIIAVSNTVAQHLTAYLGVSPERIDTICHGVDPVFLKPIQKETAQAVTRRYGLAGPFFLYCGQIYPPKNFGRLLQAYARIGPPRGVRLVVAGEHRWLSEKEISVSEELGLADWIDWVGWVTQQDLPAFYGLAEALVMPSLYEAVGIPTLEAMATGCPIVTSDRYGTLEMVGDAAALVRPDDVDDIARGLRVVLEDRELRDRLISRGRERIKQFDWQSAALATLRSLERAYSARTNTPSS